MNYRLSCAANRVKGRNCYVLELNGRKVSSKVFRFTGTNIKENVMETIAQGIKMSRAYVSHDDVLVIEVQNSNLYRWLSGLVEQSGYEEGLDRVFSVLESTDCRYMFTFIKRPYAMDYLETHGLSEITGSSFADIMEELD